MIPEEGRAETGREQHCTLQGKVLRIRLTLPPIVSEVSDVQTQGIGGVERARSSTLAELCSDAELIGGAEPGHRLGFTRGFTSKWNFEDRFTGSDSRSLNASKRPERPSQPTSARRPPYCNL